MSTISTGTSRGNEQNSNDDVFETAHVHQQAHQDKTAGSNAVSAAHAFEQKVNNSSTGT